MRKTWTKAHPGQSLIQFLLIMPILLMVILWFLRIFVTLNYEQKVAGNLWFGIRSSTYGMFTQTLDNTGVAEEIQSMFPQGTVISYQTSASQNTSIPGQFDAFGTTIGNPATITAVNALDLFSVLNVLDVSLMRTAGLSATYPNPFPSIPYFEEASNAPAAYVAGAQGYVWTSWTNFAKDPDQSVDKGQFGYDTVSSKGDLPTGKAGQYQGAMQGAINKAKQNVEKAQDSMNTAYNNLASIPHMIGGDMTWSPEWAFMLGLGFGGFYGSGNQPNASAALAVYKTAMTNYANAKISASQADFARQTFLNNIPSDVNKSEAEDLSEKYLKSAATVRQAVVTYNKVAGLQSQSG